MRCPKCKKEIDDNSLKCAYCGTKVATVCKKCGAINPIRAINCSVCNNQLLKLCKKCKKLCKKSFNHFTNDFPKITGRCSEANYNQ